MNTELNRIERILRFTIEQLNKLLSALILLISLFLFMQVLFRYVFHFPLYWVEEVVKYLMIYVTTIGGGVAFYDSGHPRIIVFCNMLPQKIRPYYEIALRILILFLPAFSYSSAPDTLWTIGGSQRAHLRSPIHGRIWLCPSAAWLSFLS